MRVRFVCEHCQQLLSVGARKIGHQVNCPKCRGAILVPAEEEAAMMLAMRRSTSVDPTATAGMEFMVYDDDETEYVYETETPAALQRPGNVAGRTAYGRIDLDKLAVPRWIVYAQGALLPVVALLAFLIGVMAGGGFSSSPERTTPVAVPRPSVVQGTVMYEDAGGKLAPDVGAVVLVVPVDARPETGSKISPEGLRPADAPPDQAHLGLRSLHVLGGSYARVSDQGTFSLQVPSAGNYFFLYLSRRYSRPVGQTPEVNDLAQMGRYFLPPTDLLGQQQYAWVEQRVEGNTQVEQTFSRPR